jgi:hypothetical protein
VIGKKNYLFEKEYITSYFGKDFKGWEDAKSVISKLKVIQDSLATRGKYLLVVIAASKADYYPEFIPDNLRVENNITNYEAFTSLARDSAIHCIDFNRYFVDQKASEKYPLFSKLGIHWSTYGSCIVQDSLVNYLNKTLKADIPSFSWENIEWDAARPLDRDIGRGLNLLVHISVDSQAVRDALWMINEGNK